MGIGKDNKVTVVGVCSAIADVFIERGWIEPVDGCGNTYRPTEIGRNELGAMFESGE